MINKLAMTFILLIFSAGLSAEGLKIGVVNMVKLTSDAPQAKDINQKLQEAVTEPKKELEQMAEDIKAMGKKIKKDELMMAPSRLEKANEEYRQKVMQFKEKELAFNQGIQNAQNRASAVFGKIVMKVVNQIAKQEKYDLIMHEGIIYVDPKHDITDKVLGVLEETYKKTSGEKK